MILGRTEEQEYGRVGEWRHQRLRDGGINLDLTGGRMSWQIGGISKGIFEKGCSSPTKR